MSIASEISRISQNVSDSLTAVAAKGVTVPSGSNSDDLAGLIAQITSGGGGGGITITDTEDSHGGIVRTITGVTISGAKQITSNGTGIDVTSYQMVDVAVPSSGGTLETVEHVQPSESSQTITPSTGYDGLASVQIDAVSSSYVGTAIDRRSSTDLTASGATVTAPAGYYASQATKTVASGTEGTPTATKGTVSSNSVTVTPSVTNVAGYIAGGTHTGTAVSVSASELVSGNKEITSNGTNIDVTNYATASVSVTPSLQAKTNIDPTTSSQTISADSGYDGLSSVQINAMPSMTLPTSASSSASSGYTSKAMISRSTSDQYINIPTGYNAAGAYYKVNAVADGSVTAPSTISGTSATVSTGTNTLTLSKTVSVTPNVTTAGYISSGTAGNSSVSLQASVTTKAATTYHPSTTDQSIASGTYLTGAQTIKAVTHNLDATKILSGTTVKIGDSTDDDCVTSVSGSLAFQTIYSGSSAPSSSTGVNGDIYIQTA